MLWSILRPSQSSVTLWHWTCLLPTGPSNAQRWDQRSWKRNVTHHIIFTEGNMLFFHACWPHPVWRLWLKSPLVTKLVVYSLMEIYRNETCPTSGACHQVSDDVTCLYEAPFRNCSPENRTKGDETFCSEEFWFNFHHQLPGTKRQVQISLMSFFLE